MAFVSDYDHDVFVSYAHLDNQGETAWVSTLVRHLDTDLRQRLGTKDLRIWIDENLDGNRPLRNWPTINSRFTYTQAQRGSSTWAGNRQRRFS
jgi:hypothetical protein